LKEDLQLTFFECDTEDSVFHLIRVLNEISNIPYISRDSRSSVFLSFPQYDNDSRDLIFIDEARQVFTKFFNEVPHVLYFIHPEPRFGQVYNFIATFLDRDQILPVEGKGYKLSISEEELYNILIKLLEPVVKFCNENFLSADLAIYELLTPYFSKDFIQLIFITLEIRPYFNSAHV